MRLDGIEVQTRGYMPQSPSLTFEELKLFTTIAKNYKDDYESIENIKYDEYKKD